MLTTVEVVTGTVITTGPPVGTVEFGTTTIVRVVSGNVITTTGPSLEADEHGVVDGVVEVVQSLV